MRYTEILISIRICMKASFILRLVYSGGDFVHAPLSRVCFSGAKEAGGHKQLQLTKADTSGLTRLEIEGASLA